LVLDLLWMGSPLVQLRDIWNSVLVLGWVLAGAAPGFALAGMDFVSGPVSCPKPCQNHVDNGLTFLQLHEMLAS
jgi:hypothetical protein